MRRKGAISSGTFRRWGHTLCALSGPVLLVAEVLCDVLLKLRTRHEQTPPLYFMLARGWIHVFGSGEVGLRSLSALFGTATVPVVYLAGAAMRSRRAGLIAAAFTALSPLTIWYSQEARNYALLLFLAAVFF